MDYSFIELARWRNVIGGQVLRTPGVGMLDLDERRNRLVVEVADESTATVIRDLVLTSGLPISAVDVIVAPIALDMIDLTDQFSDLTGGIQIDRLSGALGKCTLGFNGWWKDIDASPPQSLQRVIVTNSHCTDQKGDGSDGTTIYQNTYGSRRVGEEVEDTWYYSIPGYTGCEIPVRCRYSDAAVIGLDSNISWNFGTIARPVSSDQYSGSTTVWSEVPRFEVIDKGDWVLEGDSLDKVGATTGWTYGEVTATCIDVPRAGNKTLICQHRVDAGADEGDSGSPVFFWTGTEDNEVYLYGLLFAGIVDEYYYFSPLDGIEFDLDPIQVM